MDHIYSANGVVTDRLTDHGAHLEFRNLDKELALSCLLTVVGAFGVVLLVQITVPDVEAVRFSHLLSVLAAIGGVTACLVGFREKAAEGLRIPTKSNGIASHDHIGGLGAAIILLISSFVLLAGYAGERLHGHIIIPEWMGIVVVCVFAAVFAWVFLFSRIVDLGGIGGARKFLERIFFPLTPIGLFFSAVDSWLVFMVAPSVGATLPGVVVRYFVLFSHILIGSAFAWFAAPPFGLLGTFWALVTVLSVTRRWSWVETERNRVLQDPSIKAVDLRIGIDDDLRDEAVSSLLLLILILPIGMRQFHLLGLGYPVFQVPVDAVNRLDAWVGFFGVELLKALPFLDWADIYSTEAATRIRTSAPLSMHVLLVARAIIDLVFLSAIFQAVAISVSLAKNRTDFLNRRLGVAVLDQRIEARELSQLAIKSGRHWRYRDDIGRYLHYDPARLGRLRTKSKNGSRLHVAVCELIRLAGHKIIPPAELLPQVTASKRVAADEVRAVLDAIDELQQYDLDFLAISRRQMNWKSGLEPERKRLAQMIVNKVALSDERERELADILIGRDADSLANIRVLVVQSLARNVQIRPENLVPLSAALTGDRAGVVRSKVASEMKRLRLEPIKEVAQA